VRCDAVYSTETLVSYPITTCHHTPEDLGVTPRILKFEGCEVLTSLFSRTTPGEEDPDTYWIQGWEGPQGMVKGKDKVVPMLKLTTTP